MKKITLTMRISVHPIKAALWNERKKIASGMPLREIGKLIGVKSAQQLKHHLESMVKMGAIDYVGGEYVFPIDEQVCGRDDDWIPPVPPKPNGKTKKKVDPHLL